MLEVEKAVHSSSTPSSEDVGTAVDADPQLNVSVDSGEYELPQPKPERRRTKTTVSGVRADAARVLERFLQKTEALRITASSVHDSSDVEGEHQYAVVADQYVPPDQMPTPYQPMGSEESLCCKPGALMTTSAFDKFGAPLESDYVDCQMFLAGQGKLSSTHSFHTLGLLTRSPGAKDLVQHPPKVKSKPKRLTALDSSSSSSTEDYEYTDNELLYRKKKSFFRWASERIESIRSKGKKSTVATSVKRPDFSSKSSVPLPPPPTTTSACGGLHRNGSEKSKSNSSSTPNETTEAVLHRTGAELETLAEEQSLHKKSALTWRKSDSGKDKKKDGGFTTEEKIKDSRGVFDGLLRQFRRGSAKLKGKGSRAKHRSRSADTCAVRRPTQEAMKLVERLVDVSTRAEPPSEYESDVPAVRLSVATSQLADFDPITPPLPAKLSTAPRSASASRQVLRAKMNLDGLIACRPQMPTPKCEPFVPCYVDATDGSRGLGDLERSLAWKSSKPFADKSQCEKEELYERIAEQLAAIADKLNLESPRSVKSSSQSGPEDEKAADLPGIATAIDDQQLDALVPRPTGDLPPSFVPIEAVAAPIVAELVQNARNSDVSRFQQLVSDNVGTDTGWQAIARMFRLTQSAVHMAGMGTAVARQIKEMTLNYFEDRFASWIVDQGGWESMVEETNTELDSELD